MILPRLRVLAGLQPLQETDDDLADMEKSHAKGEGGFLIKVADAFNAGYGGAKAHVDKHGIYVLSSNGKHSCEWDIDQIDDDTIQVFTDTGNGDDQIEGNFEDAATIKKVARKMMVDWKFYMNHYDHGGHNLSNSKERLARHSHAQFEGLSRLRNFADRKSLRENDDLADMEKSYDKGEGGWMAKVVEIFNDRYSRNVEAYFDGHGIYAVSRNGKYSLDWYFDQDGKKIIVSTGTDETEVKGVLADENPKLIEKLAKVMGDHVKDYRENYVSRDRTGNLHNIGTHQAPRLKRHPHVVND